MKTRLLLIFVFTIFLACDDIIEVVDISGETVKILAPTNDAFLNITDVSFNWQSIEEAEEYNIQIATPSFAGALQILTDTTLSTTSFSKTLDLGSYQWRVKAINSGYETEYTTQSFTIEE
jgi:hypothetical protein